MKRVHRIQLLITRMWLHLMWIWMMKVLLQKPKLSREMLGVNLGVRMLMLQLQELMIRMRKQRKIKWLKRIKMKPKPTQMVRIKLLETEAAKIKKKQRSDESKKLEDKWDELSWQVYCVKFINDVISFRLIFKHTLKLYIVITLIKL